MSIEEIIFYVFAAMGILAALLLVNIRNTARALFLLFIVLFAMAGLYLFALADFVAITQILVYVGGVLILLIFAFMLSNKELLADLQSTTQRFIALPNWQAFMLALAFLSTLIFVFIGWGKEVPEWIHRSVADGTLIRPSDNNVEALGFKFMTQYILPFEVISIFLMMALIGAAHLSRKEEKQ
ncbi:NADH-quinone oxidoreductase subunit J family protein [Sphingobacterium suaedae]|uniref:NADH-quinone oxidoreductase subunit J n=1 Tax=Sphingobacterium suaedae TaxID=1686402 RepID=A0ABW5KMF0_9SPHI